MSLRSDRADLAFRANDIVGRAYREGRAMTGEEHGEWRRIQTDADALKGRIDHDERRVPFGQPNKRFCNWLAGRTEDDGPFAKRDLLSFSIADQAPRSLGEARAMSTLSIGAGAALSAFESPLATALESSLLSYDGVREAGATEVRTERGTDLPVPMQRDHQNKGRIVREGVVETKTDPAFSLMRLGAFTYSSDEVQLPVSLFQDSDYPVEQLLGATLGERIARAQSEHFVVGDAADEPKGVWHSATDSGVVTAAAGAISYTELVSLQHSVDPAYRANGKFMLNDATLLSIRQTLDSTGRPIWTPAISAGASDLIAGKPYVISPHIPAIAASVKSLLFGDFSKYVIRTVQGATLTVLRERYAEKGQVAFILFIRSDGGLANAGTNPIKYLTQHA